MNNGATPDGAIIVGLYVDPPNSAGQSHGYVVQNGTFRPYDIPGSTATQIWGINSEADFVGLYDDDNNHEHGFLQRWGEDAAITIDVPSGPPFNATLTDAFAINSAGVIVGLYIDATGNYHGYVAHPSRGRIALGNVRQGVGGGMARSEPADLPGQPLIRALWEYSSALSA